MANTLESLATELGTALSPLSTAFQSPQAVVKLLNQLGWELPPGVSDIGLVGVSVETLITKLKVILNSTPEDREDELLMLSRVAELTGEVISLTARLIQVANNLSTTLGSGLQNYISTSKIDATNATTGIPELIQRLLDFLIVSYISRRSPISFSVLQFLAIIELEPKDAQPSLFQTSHVRPIVHYDRLPLLVSNPVALFERGYGWGTTDFNATLLLSHFSMVLQMLGATVQLRPMSRKVEEALVGRPVPEADTDPAHRAIINLIHAYGYGATADVNLAAYEVRASNAGNDGGIGFMPIIRGTADLSFPLFADLSLELDANVDFKGGVNLILRPNLPPIVESGMFSGATTIPLTGKLGIGLHYGTTTGAPKILLSFPGGSRLDIQQIDLIAGVVINSSNQFEPTIDLDIKKFRFLLQLGGADSFVKQGVGTNKLEAYFDLLIRWSPRGIKFEGSGALELMLPANIQIGPVKIEGFFLRLAAGTADNLSLEVSTALSLKLGPLAAAVTRLGAQGTLDFSKTPGNLGPFDLQMGFKAPSGIGLTLDTTVVKAGGYLYIDEPKGEYFGALEIEIKPISLAIKAVGIINTKMPDGEEGFSLLIILTAEFMPIQLGFGFSLVGLGGLFGYNRTMDTDYLRRGLRQGTLNSILFPKDVVKNINNIVKDVKGVFPIKRGQFVVGPMAKIGWGSPPLITVELGVIIEFPDPIRIAIAGIIRALLPKAEAPILVLQIHFLGILDFEKKLISLDASLIDSKVLTMTLSGDFALRLGWGSPGMFILSAGGFHPSFKDAPPDLQDLKRLGITIINTDNVKIWADSYFAITSNTVQFGASIHLFAQAGPFKATAEAGMDALIQFNPFWFTFSVYISAHLTGPAIDASVDIRGSISGPNPWHAKGHVKAKFIIEIDIPLEVTWGEEIPEVAQESENVFELLKVEVGKMTNWKAVAGGKTAGKISLRPPDPKAASPVEMVLHPDSILEFSQRLVPLDIEIQKFGKKTVDGINKYVIAGLKFGSKDADITENKFDAFAPGNFFEIQAAEGSPEQMIARMLKILGIPPPSNMNEAAQLAHPSFAEYKSGKILKMNAATPHDDVKGAPREKNVDYELHYVRNEFREKIDDPQRISGNMFGKLAGAGAAAKSVLSNEHTQQSPLAPPVIYRNKPTYMVMDSSIGLMSGAYSSHVEAYAAQNEMGLADKQNSLVVSSFEL